MTNEVKEETIAEMISFLKKDNENYFLDIDWDIIIENVKWLEGQYIKAEAYAELRFDERAELVRELACEHLIDTVLLEIKKIYDLCKKDEE